MPVATMLAIAASFWGSHGYVQPPIAWDWADQATLASIADPGYMVQAYVGEYDKTIHLNRTWWDHASNQEKCEVVIHEDGHVLGFKHQAGTVMAPYEDQNRPVPGTCKRSKRAWKKIARAS